MGLGQSCSAVSTAGGGGPSSFFERILASNIGQKYLCARTERDENFQTAIHLSHNPPVTRKPHEAFTHRIQY